MGDWRTKIGAGALLALAAGCGPAPGGMPPPSGTLQVVITPGAFSVPNLQVASGSLTIEGMSVYGDVASGVRSTIVEMQLDLLGNPLTFDFATIPQGLYSRVHFFASELHLQGSWRGTPLLINFEADQTPVDLRSAAGQDVEPGMNGTFEIAEDTGSWFGGTPPVLDSATPAGGQIVIDPLNNLPVANTLASRIVAAFSLQPSPQ
jgi:hypothetical protein